VNVPNGATTPQITPNRIVKATLRRFIILTQNRTQNSNTPFTSQKNNASTKGSVAKDRRSGGNKTEPPPTKVEGFSVLEHLRCTVEIFSD